MEIKCLDSATPVNSPLLVLATLVSLLSLSACGFHLRGNSETLVASFPKLAVQCNKKSDWQMCHYLNARITAMGTEISDDARFLLKVDRVQSSQRAISLNNDATAAEQELTHTMHYRLRDMDHGTTVSERMLSRSQIYRLNASALVAKDREKEELEKSLNQSLVNTLLREISIASRDRETGPQATPRP